MRLTPPQHLHNSPHSRFDIPPSGWSPAHRDHLLDHGRVRSPRARAADAVVAEASAVSGPSVERVDHPSA